MRLPTYTSEHRVRRTAHRARKWLYAGITTLLSFQIFHVTSSASLPSEVLPEFITAHRGSSFAAPENTLEAIRRAIYDRAGMVEFDVRLTADGVAVLSHDDSLKRTAGVDMFVSKSAYADIRDIDVSHSFARTYPSVHIPTLEEALKTARGHLLVNIELKPTFGQTGLVEEVVRVVAELGMEDDAVITSFSRELLAEVRERSETLKTGLIIGTKKDLTDDVFDDGGIDILSLRATLIDSDVMGKARSNDKLVYVWTVNSTKLMKEMLRYQVDSIITDRPALLYDLIH